MFLFPWMRNRDPGIEDDAAHIFSRLWSINGMVHYRRVRQYASTRAIPERGGVTGLLLRSLNHLQILSRFRQSLSAIACDGLDSHRGDDGETFAGGTKGSSTS